MACWWRGAGRQFARLGGPLEDAGMRAGLGQLHRHLVAAGGGQFDGDLIGLVGQVAVGVLDAEIDEVARLDLVLRADPVPCACPPPSPLASRSSFLLKVSSSSSTILLEADFQFAVGCDANLGIGQRHVLEFLLELGRIVHADQSLPVSCSTRSFLAAAPRRVSRSARNRPLPAPPESR